MKTALITGTSSGIGLTTSLKFAQEGYKVYAAMRNLAKSDALSEAAKSAGLDIQLIELDVCDNDSVDRAFAEIYDEGPIDVLVNNAGIGGSSPLELTPEAEHRQMFETNYFGAIRCIKAVIPHMRERETGAIANITSAVGLIATPNQIAYSASKHALECAGEALAHELKPFNVRVVNVEPGVIMTSIFENSAEQTRYDKTSPYQPLMRRNGKVFAAGFKRAVQPDVVADVIFESLTTDDYKFRWAVGPDAEGFMAARDNLSSEDWIAMGASLSDEEYNERFKTHFGIDL